MDRSADAFGAPVVLRSELTAFQKRVGRYLLDFLPAGSALVVTFETADQKIDRSDDLRDPWGAGFFTRRGFSVLGVKARQTDWYRGPRLHAWFRSPQAARFFARFDRVVFAGGSMGGFAALAFSRVVPGSTVLAHNPQSTLHPRLVPWETRFAIGSRQNWSGDFADAAAAVPFAGRVFVTYDPLFDPDRRHVARLDGAAVVHLKLPFLGHETPRWLQEMGILRSVTEGALDGSLTAAAFARLARRRKTLPRYHALLAEAVRARRSRRR